MLEAQVLNDAEMRAWMKEEEPAVEAPGFTAEMLSNVSRKLRSLLDRR